MSGSVLPSLARVRLGDLVASEGLPSEAYRISVSILAQSIAQYSAAIIQFPPSDCALLRAGLESARFFFHQRAYPASEMVHMNDARVWCKTSGYYSEPQLWQETYDFRPGITPTEGDGGMEFPPAGLPDIYALLGKAARDILDAIGFSLNLRSCSFGEILDNIPLRNREISSSVLSVWCHSRPSFQGANQEEVIFPDNGEHQVEKSLLTVVKPDAAGLHVKDFHGRWVLVDGDLGPHDAVIYPGLGLYQATAGYVSPALYRVETVGNLYGRCSLGFKLMARSMASFSSSEMIAAGHGVEVQFQLPVLVDDFMQRSHPTEQLFAKPSYSSYTVPDAAAAAAEAALMKRRKSGSTTTTRCKPLPPSKRLRLEAQRVLKERVQDIADRKGIKLRFCNLKECCESHVQSLDSPCGSIRMEIGWPHGVPFVHPHDLPNKAKVAFLEAYEPGWTAAQDCLDSAALIEHHPT